MTVFEVPIGPALVVSFQRYRCPASGLVDATVASCGAVPVLAPGPGLLLVPCPDGEALWIGLLPAGAGGVVTVRALDVELTVPVPPVHALAGMPRSPGAGPRWAIARHTDGAPVCRRIEIMVESGSDSAAVRVDLIDSARYAALSGRTLPPLDESAAYGGWLLP